MGDDPHLGGRRPGWQWREPPRFLVANWVHLLGCHFCDAHLLAIPDCGQFIKWAAPCWNDGEDHFVVSDRQIHPLLYHLCRGQVPVTKLERQWAPGTVLLLPGSSGGALSLTWPRLILRDGRFCSQCVKLQELGVQLPCSDTDFLYNLGPVTWSLSVSVSYGTINASLTLRTCSLLSVRG